MSTDASHVNPAAEMETEEVKTESLACAEGTM